MDNLNRLVNRTSNLYQAYNCILILICVVRLHVLSTRQPQRPNAEHQHLCVASELVTRLYTVHIVLPFQHSWVEFLQRNQKTFALLSVLRPWNISHASCNLSLKIQDFRSSCATSLHLLRLLVNPLNIEGKIVQVYTLVNQRYLPL